MPTDDLAAIIKLMDEHIELAAQMHSEMFRALVEFAEKVAKTTTPPPDEGKSND